MAILNLFFLAKTLVHRLTTMGFGKHWRLSFYLQCQLHHLPYLAMQDLEELTLATVLDRCSIADLSIEK